jgi:hypothetical protein
MFREQKASVALMTFADYTKQDPHKALAELYSEKELVEVAARPYLFFTGNPKTSIDVPGTDLRSVPASVLVLDKAMKPILASEVTLLLPAK